MPREDTNCGLGLKLKLFLARYFNGDKQDLRPKWMCFVVIKVITKTFLIRRTSVKNCDVSPETIAGQCEWPISQRHASARHDSSCSQLYVSIFASSHTICLRVARRRSVMGALYTKLFECVGNFWRIVGIDVFDFIFLNKPLKSSHHLQARLSSLVYKTASPAKFRSSIDQRECSGLTLVALVQLAFSNDMVKSNPSAKFFWRWTASFLGPRLGFVTSMRMSKTKRLSTTT
jgi:hypothetical protein